MTDMLVPIGDLRNLPGKENLRVSLENWKVSRASNLLLGLLYQLYSYVTRPLLRA